ncbi:hypothetical protein CROQUDRAFT_663561 [Cronartium quercuum f. sp. fusiforme G11]|uniref:Lipid droplet-associated hydrolase n=1 Tax=Cronartium quercuum f. sp. fusiforme G11 TaxID=708437 RepID=A0A9P6T7I7_9BASI|nr:hypothetical protein CROQUDRAFT_663561 [Cronartium quercuum f. sp. fusiforme G11]
MAKNPMTQDSSESSRLMLPFKTAFAWRPSVYPPSDIHMWGPAENLSLNHTLARPPKCLIILIPGNPGLVSFYDMFLGQLFNSLVSKKISNQILCVGHVGHSFNNSNFDFRFLQNFGLNSNRPGFAKLQEQIEYHQDFVGHLTNLVDFKQTKLILIGHSVGAYIAAKVLEKHPGSVFHMFGLFPTLSKIGNSRNGRSMAPLFSPITLPFLHILQLFFSLVMPKAMLMLLVKLVTTVINISGNQPPFSYHNLTKACDLVKNVNTVSAALIMARSEMKEILEIDPNFIQTHKEKISLYYTKKNDDAWIDEVEFDQISQLLDSLPNDKSSKVVDEATNMSARFANPREGFQSGKRYERSTEGIPHAFCLEHNEIMAQKCAVWIESLLDV